MLGVPIVGAGRAGLRSLQGWWAGGHAILKAWHHTNHLSPFCLPSSGFDLALKLAQYLTNSNQINLINSDLNDSQISIFVYILISLKQRGILRSIVYAYVPASWHQYPGTW